MNIFVCDASVLVTALFGANKDIAAKLDQVPPAKSCTVHILPFTIVEFANGVRFSTREIPLAKQVLERFAALALPVLPIAPADVHAIMELSYRMGTTVYDTAYHYAAIMREGVFITCDRGYFKKASQLGHIELWG